MRLSPLLLASALAGLDRARRSGWNEAASLMESLASGTLLPRQASGNLPPYRISLPLDHNGETDARFHNRFWVNATYYESGGPVIFFDLGEMDGQRAADNHLTEEGDPTPVMRLAARYKGLAIAWEHRFYGDSFPPTNPTKRFAPEWKYHTVKQALDDVVVFANRFANETTPSATRDDPFQFYAVHPSKTPWITVARSYPGARIAYLRDKHPEIFFAGWGSSVCSAGEVNSPSYYSIIQSALPANCSSDWAAIRAHVDERLRNGSGGLRFGGEDEINALVSPAGAFQMSGLESILPFCDTLETLNGAIAPSPQGMVASRGVESAYEAYAGLIQPYLDSYKSSLAYFEGSTDFQSWMYQECYELGGFRIHDSDNPNSFVSSLVTEESIAEICHEKFQSDFLPTRPKVDELNELLGGWDVNPSNFLFTDGEFDPWRIITPSWPKKQGTVREASASIPKCNIRPPLERYFGKVYEGAVHMPDYKLAIGMPSQTEGRDREIFETSLQLFQNALDEWLPCFGQAPPGHVDDAGNGLGGGGSGTNGSGDQGNGARTVMGTTNALATLLFAVIMGVFLV